MSTQNYRIHTLTPGDNGEIRIGAWRRRNTFLVNSDETKKQLAALLGTHENRLSQVFLSRSPSSYRGRLVTMEIDDNNTVQSIAPSPNEKFTLKDIFKASSQGPVISMSGFEEQEDYARRREVIVELTLNSTQDAQALVKSLKEQMKLSKEVSQVSLGIFHDSTIMEQNLPSLKLSGVCEEKPGYFTGKILSPTNS